MADMLHIWVIIKRQAGLDIAGEKMSFQWPDKPCNGILWMVLAEKREDLLTTGEELWKESARI